MLAIGTPVSHTANISDHETFEYLISSHGGQMSGPRTRLWSSVTRSSCGWRNMWRVLELLWTCSTISHRFIHSLRNRLLAALSYSNAPVWRATLSLVFQAGCRRLDNNTVSCGLLSSWLFWRRDAVTQGSPTRWIPCSRRENPPSHTSKPLKLEPEFYYWSRWLLFSEFPNTQRSEVTIGHVLLIMFLFCWQSEWIFKIKFITEKYFQKTENVYKKSKNQIRDICANVILC